MPHQLAQRHDNGYGDAGLVIARVRDVRGLRGELKIEVLSDIPGRMENAACLLCELRGGDVVRVEKEWFRRDANTAILKLSGIDDRESALRFKGAYFSMDPADSGELPDGMYYQHDIVGFDVCDIRGDRVGKVSAVERFPAQDVFIVDTGAEEIMVPVVDDFVKSIDMNGSVVVLDMREGLPAVPRKRT